MRAGEMYLGVKIIHAEPISRHEFTKEQIGITGETGHNSDDIPGYKVTYEDGYVSWSPKDVFEKAYRRIDNLTFGLAVEALKQGKKIARKGWSGKKMFLLIVYPYSNDYFYVTEKEQIPGTLLPWIGMKTADNGFVPWIASQTDILAEDWEIVE